MKEGLRKFIITKLFLRIFLKQKYFLGDFASNHLAMRKWYNEETAGDVIIMDIQNSRLPFHPMLPDNAGSDVIRALVREQARIHARKLRKQHQCIVYYVEDNFISRLAGCSKGYENKILAA